MAQIEKSKPRSNLNYSLKNPKDPNKHFDVQTAPRESNPRWRE